MHYRHHLEILPRFIHSYSRHHAPLTAPIRSSSPYYQILIIRGGDPAIEGHSALPIGSEAETNRRSDWLTGDSRSPHRHRSPRQCSSDRYVTSAMTITGDIQVTITPHGRRTRPSITRMPRAIVSTRSSTVHPACSGLCTWASYRTHCFITSSRDKVAGTLLV